jgi:2,3-bisphosphoglycerate-independent phosphoglycerate mutase
MGMKSKQISPLVLVILDGWGYRKEKEANAIALAKTPVMESLWTTYPSTLINTSGRDVGLPDGQMGNSEVGHVNIGAGRIVPQELVRISDAVDDGSINGNKVLLEICQDVKKANTKLHLIGLCSQGGVHSHLTHLFGLLDLAKIQKLDKVCIHVLTDGRDTSPDEGINSVNSIENHINSIGVGRIVTISGRYFAMDRDRRWDRVQKAYQVMTENSFIVNKSASELVRDFYSQSITDEFIPPTRIAEGAIESGDGVIFFNFRPDRARELSQALVMPKFDGFERKKIETLHMATFTQYDISLPVKIAFEPQNLDNILPEVISNQGLRQFRVAETEKYPHVTYFFNGGREEPLPLEDRELIQSPMVSTYDKVPAMSAQAVTDAVCRAIAKGVYSLIVVNYANPDMVGHTGNLIAAIEAVESVDVCIGELLNCAQQKGGTVMITADHGNAEYMSDAEGNPWTAHTTNPVPFILIEGEGLKIIGHGGAPLLRSNGKLADIAPTILDILQLSRPEEMTGVSLILPSSTVLKESRSPLSISL